LRGENTIRKNVSAVLTLFFSPDFFSTRPCTHLQSRPPITPEVHLLPSTPPRRISFHPGAVPARAAALTRLWWPPAAGPCVDAGLAAHAVATGRPSPSRGRHQARAQGRLARRRRGSLPPPKSGRPCPCAFSLFVPRDASPRPKFHATKPNPKAQAKPEER